MPEGIGADFARTTFTHDGRTREVYRGGAGPAVVVVHELPNLHPGVVDFARRLVAAGYTVYLPSLLGRPGAPLSAVSAGRSFARACVSREFAVLADRTSPVTGWLRALAAQAHRECGGPGVGAVGMCFSGGFALAMAVEPAVLAPVLSQPSLPLPFGARRRAALGLDPDDLQAVRERTRDGLCLLGLRFTEDRLSPADRFRTLRDHLGDAVEVIEIDSSPGNSHGIPRRAHSVVTLDLVDEPGHPTRAALDRVLAFLADRLRPA